VTRSLAGRVIVITGGARGIGASTARLLASRGAKVAIGDIDAKLVAQTASELGVQGFGVDVTDADGFAAFLNDVTAALGPIDVLINNAGIMPLHRIDEEPDEVTQRIVEINQMAVIRGTREIVRRWKADGRGGHIINVSSAAGRIPIAGASTYVASKHAVSGFSNSLHIEFQADRVPIEVTAVHPAMVLTELSAGFAANKGVAKPVTPEQVADGILSALERPRPDVYVPRSLGVAVRTGGLIPRRVGEWLNRVLGGERAALDAMESPERRSYEDRVGGQGT
jgi:NAD(P)-dependent dehydrogenase (short-subunit alcohol dehydrogenase family)